MDSGPRLQSSDKQVLLPSSLLCGPAQFGMKHFFCRVLNVMDCRMKNKFPLLLGNEFLLLSLLVLSFTWAWWGRLITVMAKAVLQQAYLKTWGCLFHPATCTAQVCWAILFLIENASLQNQNFSWRRLQFCQKKKKKAICQWGNQNDSFLAAHFGAS